MSDSTITPVPLSLDDARASLNAAEQVVDQQFLGEFKALCEKYGRHLEAEIILRGGAFPVARLTLARS